MTYAYIESVYPDFVKHSTISQPTFPQKITYKPFENSTQQLQYNSPIPNNNIFKPHLESNINNQVIKTPEYNWDNYKTNNLKYYKDPIPEQFTQESTIPLTPNSHTEYINHVLQCEQCKNIITKQLNLDIDKAKMDEWMELLSYILFGIFILLLLDSFKK